MMIQRDTVIALIVVVLSIVCIVKSTNFVIRGMFIALCIYAGNILSKRYLGFDLFLYVRQVITLQV